MKSYKKFSNRYEGQVYAFRIEVYLWEILIKYFDGDEHLARKYLRGVVHSAIRQERTLTAAVREAVTQKIARNLFDEAE